jgi:hypothetical protein
LNTAPNTHALILSKASAYCMSVVMNYTTRSGAQEFVVSH